MAESGRAGRERAALRSSFTSKTTYVVRGLLVSHDFLNQCSPFSREGVIFPVTIIMAAGAL